MKHIPFYQWEKSMISLPEIENTFITPSHIPGKLHGRIKYYENQT